MVVVQCTPCHIVGAGACRRCERVARGSPLGGQPADAGRRERRPLQGLRNALGLVVGRGALTPPRLSGNFRMLTAACRQAALQHRRRPSLELVGAQ